ncbi:SMP-30/gluconolactonase/LRE family protein [Pseudonocardia sp. S2-4]|uniref:SMP-30/gluconolactonase/LRE family protein n=1 Tax=Pseudonocardia humida TaxID=2800819 RepID=A0ABT1A771_9PSEU|nr:SMP-30/gluconolactonase/LRE family protein [Pseudonocardia humida]
MLAGGWTTLPGERFALGEGSRLVPGPDGDRVVMVDIPTGRLLVTDPRQVLADLDVPLGAVAPLADGSGWLAAAGTGIAVLGADGAVEWVDRPEDGAPVAMRMNDGVADPSGRFWAGSMAADQSSGSGAGAGSLYRVDPDGSVHRVLDGLTIPNGPAFSADGTLMYLAESTAGVIHRARVDPATGALGPLEEFARVGDGSPDGMTVDAEGCVWSAVHGGGRVDRYTAEGVLLESLRLPAAQPTSVCLTAEPPHAVLVTSAATGLPHPGDADGAVLVAPVRVAGRRADTAARPGG